LTKEDYLENTFGLEDIYTPDSITVLKNSSAFNLKELMTLLNGRIFVICPLKSFKSHERIEIYLQKGAEFEFSVYNPGEEYWFTLSRLKCSKTFLSVAKKVTVGIVKANGR